MNTSEIRPNVLLGIPSVESSAVLGEQLVAAGCEIDRAQTITECQSLLEKREFKLVVLDMSLNGIDGIDAVSLCRRNASLLSRTAFIFTSANKPMTSDDRHQAMSVGAHDVIEMPLNAGTIAQLVQLTMDQCSQPLSAPGDTKSALKVTADTTAANGGSQTAHERRLDELERILVGDSPSMAAIRKLISEVAATRASVMIYGERGNGKELIAQAIHQHSKQANGPFVPVDMATVPHGSSERLLFGHEKGAVTTEVHNQQGWCEAAHGGTLFLDEIADLEMQVQPTLLRFLQEGILHHVGSHVPQRVSVRVITATNRDPRTIVSEGRLREDLFFRLHVVPIFVPPLRDRPEDIPTLAMLFLRRSAERHERMVEGFSDDALRVLQQHDWPGNVRQLENTVERLVVFARGRIVEADHIPAEDHLASAYAERRRVMIGAAPDRSKDPSFDPFVCLTPIERHERAAIVDALRRVDGHVIDAARLLGLGQATVYRKIKQYVIPNERKRRVKRPK